MSSNENLFHKLLGIPEKIESPNYFEMLELQEGDTSGPQVEDAYKKQIQKVQRFTNNPKYKEAALFIKGELRKARGALIDEAKRTGYVRDLLQSRTQDIRTLIKPLLIKGYLVEQEYAYLSAEALRMRVPEAVIQQVIKQELEKKGIDPTSAIREGEDDGSGKGRSVISPAQQAAKRKHTAPKTLSAHLPWLRYLHPSELFTVETAKALATSPLWLVGLKRYPPRHGQPVAGGLVFHAPFIAAMILMLGAGMLAIPYSEADLLGFKADADIANAELGRYQREVERLQTQVKPPRAGGPAVGGGGSSDGAEVERLKTELATAQADLATTKAKLGDMTASTDPELRKEVDELRAKNKELRQQNDDLDAKIYELKKELRGIGSGSAPVADEKELEQVRNDLAGARKELDEQRQATATATAARDAAESLSRQHQADAQSSLATRNKDLMDLLDPLKKVKFKPELDRVVFGRVMGVAGESDIKGAGVGDTVGISPGPGDGVKVGETFVVLRIIPVAEVRLMKLNKQNSTAEVIGVQSDSTVLKSDVVFRVLPR